ncbi:MAG: hypothetical protein ACLRO4_07470 [Lachnospiraceae bacterium]
MDAVIEAFGELTVASVIVCAAAIIYMRKLYNKWKKEVIEQHDTEKERDEKIQTCLDQISLYPEWRKQSIDIQQKFTEAINDLKEVQKKNIDRLEEIEAANQKRERNKIRDRLLQSYRYFTSKEKNPMLAWSEMEAEAFWKIFKDYEDLDGNGHVHSEVQPAMRNLEVIPMHEVEKISELMHSRR